MDFHIAEELAEEFVANNGYLPKLNKDHFLDELLNLDVSLESAPQFTLPEKKQTIHENPNRRHYASLRRVVRNDKVREIRLPLWKTALHYIASDFITYSSDEILSDIKNNRPLLEMICKSNSSFSLFGKVKTYDTEEDGTTYIISRPVLVIPGISSPRIKAWEVANTVIRKESPFLGKYQIKQVITAEDYAEGR